MNKTATLYSVDDANGYRNNGAGQPYVDLSGFGEPADNEITGFELLNEASETIDWLIENLFPRTGLGCVAGGSDLGKSALLRFLGISIVADCNNFLGFNIKAVSKSVIMVCSEDDRSAVSYLLNKQAANFDRECMKELRFVFDWENLLEELDERLTRKPADLIILDCFSDVFGGDLKDTQKIRLFLNGYQKLSVKHNCFILFLHHTAKRTEALEPSKNNLLAGQGFEAKMRIVMELRADPMNGEYRHLCIVKGNYLPASMKRESFVLRFNEADFTFSTSGERTAFEFLVKQQEDGGKTKYVEAKDLKAKGYSMETIAEQMGYANKSSISRLLEKGIKNGW